ncbi:hybrid sensor histidine kinase/response regulator [Aquabacterium humicola]|uniref:hybrid sensor histidine kinase/response regulator n=1 Tax=Aquabacterium humicola TaxID=3237377 RepID=UPI0025427B17|nr:ATP-binding protein [Rubrivivax pictus]
MTTGRGAFIDRVRWRLLAAFFVLLFAAIALAGVGWWGMRSTQRALAGVEHDLLPNISHALELAQRTTQLALVAPKLSESATEAELEAHRASAQDLLQQIRRRSVDLQPARELQQVIGPLHEQVGRQLETLITLTRDKQRLQQALALQRRQLERLGERLHGAARPAGQRSDDHAAITALWSTLVLGLAAEDAASIGRLQADVEALLLAARRRGAWQRLPAADTTLLSALAAGADGLLAQRQRLLDLESRSGYLVVLARANADELGDEVSRYVARLRGAAAERSDALARAVRSGETGVLALALVAIVIAVLATRYVRRLVGEVETITALMSRLAQGDTGQPTPATRRRDELGELARSFEVFRDQALAQQRLVGELHTQREQLEAVLESLTDGLAVFDRQRRLLLWNRRFAELLAPLGAQPQAGIAADALLAGLPAGARWQASPGIETTLDAVWGGAGHAELLLPDGGAYDLRSRTMPAGGSVTLVTDLTARRAIERELQQSQKLEVLGQLTGGVAHDFNNYLGTMLGNLALLEAELAGAPRPQQLWQRIQRAAASAAGLTRRLLAFARRQPLQAERVEIDGMLEEMHDLVEYSAGEAVDVQLALGAPGVCVHVDRGQLENAVLNLVLNGAAAMPQGGRLRLVTSRPDEGCIELAVADEGVGLPEALREKVFEPFFTTKGEGKGSGLGLSIVYGFVKQSGGDITLDSRVGAGTTVRLRFPVAATVERALPGPRRPAQPVDAPGLAGLRLLVVEDDEAYRATLLDLLAEAGAVTDSRSSAEDALAWLDAQGEGALPQLVLSDICLGRGQDGLQLARTLRRRWPALPVILMSGMAPEMLGQPTTWLQDFGFLQKPFALQALADVSRIGPRHEHS